MPDLNAKPEKTGRTLLVVHPGAVGDVLLARPALGALKARFPTHALGLIAGRQVGSLLRVCGEVDELFPIESDALAGLLAGHDSVNHAVREWLARCDVAVCWLTDAEGRLRSVLLTFGVARVIIQSPVSSDSDEVRQADRLMETIRDVAPARGEERVLGLPESIVMEGRRLAAEGLGTPPLLVAIHPGSGSPAKCCEPALLAGLIERLYEDGRVPLLVVGPADEDQGQAVLDWCVRRPTVLRGMDLLEMAGALVQAALFVGHDSGLTHLAAALAVPTVALFGPTDPHRWAPRGPHVTVLTGEPCRCEGWEAVKACTGKPCFRISPGALVAACERTLRRQPDRVQKTARELPCSARRGMLESTSRFSE